MESYKGVSTFLLIVLAFGLFGLGLFAVSEALKVDPEDYCRPKLLEQAFKLSAEWAPKPEPIEPEIQIVKACQGFVLRNVPSELEGETRIAREPRTILFFKSNKGTPEIISTRIENLRVGDFPISLLSSVSVTDINHQNLSDHGILAEHGSLESLRYLDRQNGQIHYDHLMQEAAETCLGSPEENASFDEQSANLFADIENSATAFATYSIQVNNSDARLVVFYRVDGKIYQRELPLDLRPI